MKDKYNIMDQQAKLTLLLTGFLKTYVAVFYESSAVFVFIGKQVRKKRKEAIRRKTKNNKTHTISQNDNKKIRNNEFANEYLSVSKEEAICENNKNFEVRYSDIETIDLSPCKMRSTKAFGSNFTLGQIQINAYSDKYHFNHKYLDNDETILRLQDLFADKFVRLR